jgi:hypothetical protein
MVKVVWAGKLVFNSCQEQQIFLFSTQPNSEAHPDSYTIGTSGLHADHSPPSTAKVKNGGAILILPAHQQGTGTVLN